MRKRLGILKKEAQSHLAATFLPYEPGVKLQRKILSQKWVQELIYPRRLRLLRSWTALCYDSDAPDTVLTGLMCNTWIHWRMEALKAPDIIARWVSVKGEENLVSMSAAGRGIVFVALHSVGAGVLLRYLRSRFPRDPAFIQKVDRSRKQADRMAGFARQIIGALAELQQGGIVYVAADAPNGRASVDVDLYGRSLSLRTGFAELAVRTSSAALAAFVFLSPDGRILLEFCELSVPEAGSREMRVEAMVRQYAGLLVERWPQLFPSLKLRVLSRLLDLPAVGDGPQHMIRGR